MSAPEFCRSARAAIPFWRGVARRWQGHREAESFADETPRARGRSCRWARIVLEVHVARARAARRAFYRWRERMRDPEFAICHYWRSRCGEAIAVAKCESGDNEDGRLSEIALFAENGQYLGMFQMGSSERAIYGHGSTAREQARAAFAYFIASGSDWSPWSCKP